MFNDLLNFILVPMLSSILGVNLKKLEKLFNKYVTKNSEGKNPENSEISESIDTVSEKLNESKEIIDKALLEIENQKKLFEEMKQEAVISQQITSMNQEQVEAMNKLLEITLSKQEKKSFPKNLIWNLFFCVLSAVLGFILGKFL